MILLLFTFQVKLKAQDGSDIRYCKIEAADSSLIGKFVHFDFYRRSFLDIATDTVLIVIDDTPIYFIEKRRDNGFNNWFSEQYLQSIDTIKGDIIRIVKSKIISIKDDYILATNYLEYHDNDNKILPEKSNQQISAFPKKIITEILVESRYNQ
ncbi:hypothetical protein BH10BAC2_BH10BAC2_29100 [soil metagenome]